MEGDGKWEKWEEGNWTRGQVDGGEEKVGGVGVKGVHCMSDVKEGGN